jgi:quercetin dioxygenase-like cupin family protein
MADTFEQAHVSLPSAPRVARTPFGASMAIHALAYETGGAFGIWDTFTPPGQGPAPHTHTRETETFRVMRGTYRFWCGDTVFDAPVGTVVVLPPNVEHAWRNISDEPGQMLGIVTPGGCEQMFLDIAALGADATPARIAMIEARYGIANAQTRALQG